MQLAEEIAIVSHLDGDFAFLETQNRASCGNCTSKSGCGAVSSIFTYKPKSSLKVINSLKLKSGDSVVVGIHSGNFLQATLLMYLFPLMFMFSVSLFAKLFFGETESILAGLVGLFSGLFIVKKYTQIKNVANQFQPKLIRKIINVDLK